MKYTTFRRALAAVLKGTTTMPVVSGNPYRDGASMRFASRDGSAGGAPEAKDAGGALMRRSDPVPNASTKQHIDRRSQSAWNREGAEGVIREQAGRVDQKAALAELAAMRDVKHPTRDKSMNDMVEHAKTLDQNAIELGLTPAQLENANNLAFSHMQKFGKDAAYDRRAVLVIGLSGAGKTSVINAFQRDLNGVEIDSDHFKKQLKGFNNGLGSMEVHAESSVSAKAAMAMGIESGVNMILPKVGGMDSEKSIRREIDKLKKAGYAVEVHLVQLDHTESMKRVVSRFIGTKESPGEQLVPVDYVEAMKGREPIRLMEKLVRDGTLDGSSWSILHNNVGRGEPYGIIAHKGSNSLLDKVFEGKSPSDVVRAANRTRQRKPASRPRQSPRRG